MSVGKQFGIAVFALLAAACAQAPIQPSPNHLHAEAPPPPGQIPAPVQIAPVLPKPQPTVPAETYSVVVDRVPARELLFALARDARLQIDIDPSLTGLVTLNAVNQTLPQLLTRIARQVDMRYHTEGSTLVIVRDTPFLRSYKIDYLSANRAVSMRSTASTQFGTGTGVQGASNSGSTGAVSTIEVTAQNNLWESIVQNVRQILRETQRVAPAAGAPPGGQAASAAPLVPAVQEASAVIGNRETGVLFVRATSTQHERIQQFLDQVMAGAMRQVLIEATIAEVQLNNKYQRGIDWSRLSSSGNGFTFGSQGAPLTDFNPPNPFQIGFFNARRNLRITLNLLEQFGDVRVLSSPKLSVLNNQTAILRVTRDIVYFTLTPSTTPVTIAAGTGTQPINAIAFTTTPNVAAEGFMMTVLPEISAADSIVLNVKPTIRRKVADATDPNPALTTIPNNIPVFETREFDSILRLQSGQTAVLAGLMQDQINNNETAIPGVRSIPLVGEALTTHADQTTKTELVIFLRATVIDDPSIDGDFRAFRDQLPRSDFFSKPNPQKAAPPVMPGEAQ